LTQKETLGNLISSDHCADHHPIYHRLIVSANAAAERLLALKTLKNIHQDIPAGKNSAEFLNNVLDRFQIRHSIYKEDMHAIPQKGPTVVIANHPFGGIDGVLLASILCTIRSDVKILANYFLDRIPEMRPLLFNVDPFGNKTAIHKNRTALKQAVRWITFIIFRSDKNL
jgi:putative hemolysin